MKRIFALILIVLTVLSLGGVIGYSIYRTHASGGQPPEISFDRDVIEVETNATDVELLAGVTAKDKEDGDVTDSLLVEHISDMKEENSVVVTYVAFDSQNHVTRATRTAIYTDYVRPHFTVTRPLLFTAQSVSDMMDCIGAKDSIDGDLSSKVRASFDNSEQELRSVGVHEVEFTVTNSVGDTVRLTLPVRVVDESPRSDQLPLKSYLVYLNRGEDFDPRSYLTQETASALYGEDDDPEEDPLVITSNVDTVTAGVYAADYSLVRSDQVVAMTRLIVIVE